VACREVSDQEGLARALERVDYLERINRWHMDALEMLTSMGHMHGDASAQRDAKRIFTLTRRYLYRLLPFADTAFLLVDETEAAFVMADCEPAAVESELQMQVDALIESGRFAWALNQNRPVEISPEAGGQRLLLHVLATRTRVRGMFVGTLPSDRAAPSAAELNLLTVVLQHAAYVLESSALYRMVSRQNENLETLVAERTAELEHQSAHDALTGLPNRVLFLDRVGQAAERARRTGLSAAVVLIDLDLFKRINDTLGPRAGDRLLQQVAQRLHTARQELQQRDCNAESGIGISIARLGGDEFGLLFSDIIAPGTLVRAVNRFMDGLTGLFVLDGHQLRITSSVGISLAPEDGVEAETLLKHAEAAMYHAKEQGRNNYQFYAPHLNASSLQQLLLENELRSALVRQEFLLYFQPKVDMTDGRVHGVEALVRWRHPVHGLVGPDTFIPVMEQCGLIRELGRWVLRAACRQICSWQAAGRGELCVAVNLSARQFQREELLADIDAVLAETGLEPGRLELEITESTLMEDSGASVDTLRALHERGVRLSIDDFGTGYSSLSYLKRFPIDTLKIDRSFIHDIPTDAEDRAIVHAVIAMARSLNLRVVAEGVESAAQLDFLHRAGCDEVQGFLLGRPVPPRRPPPWTITV